MFYFHIVSSAIDYICLCKPPIVQANLRPFHQEINGGQRERPQQRPNESRRCKAHPIPNTLNPIIPFFNKNCKEDQNTALNFYLNI